MINNDLLTAIGKDKRIRIFVGHYGSGKTELSVNYSLALRRIKKDVTICDLDIVNPYFRSREVAEELTAEGVNVISGAMGHGVAIDLPMISADVYAPLQNSNTNTVLDIGGDPVGARALARYKEFFKEENTDLFFVFNAYRERTQDARSALIFLREIEATIGFRTTALVGNTHLLRQTTGEDIYYGLEHLKELGRLSKLPIRYVAGIDIAIEDFKKKNNQKELLTDPTNGHQISLFPLKLMLRKRWQ